MASSVLLIGCICLVSNIILCDEASDSNDVTPRDGDVTMNPMMGLTSETYNVTSASVTDTDLEVMTSNMTRGQIRSGEVNNTAGYNDRSSRKSTTSVIGDGNAGDDHVVDYHMLVNDGIKGSDQEITTTSALLTTESMAVSDKVGNDYKNTMSTLLSRLKPTDSVSISDIREMREGNIGEHSQRAGLKNQKGGQVTGEGNNVLVKRNYKETINEDNDNKPFTKKLGNKMDINESRKRNEMIDKMVGFNDTENIQTMKLISLSEKEDNVTTMNMDLSDTAGKRPGVSRDSEGLLHQTEDTDEGIGDTYRYSTYTLHKMLFTSPPPPVNNNQGETSPSGGDGILQTKAF